MSTWLWIAVAIVVVVLVLSALAWAQRSRRRSEVLHERFGPEYERAVEDRGKKEAESDLEQRAERRKRLEIRPLPASSRDRYLSSWRAIQERFVDHPSSALDDADDLVRRVMRERGYPIDDFEQQAADISVDHPAVVADYRAAHAVHRKDVREGASTEERREAMLHFRRLFEHLLETDEGMREPRTDDAGERVVAGDGDGLPATASDERGEPRPVVREEEVRIRRLDDGDSGSAERPGATTNPG